MSEKRKSGNVRENRTDVVVDAGASADHRPLGKDARCRPFIASRLESSQDYARFAAAAGVDILIGGEALAGFKTVNRLDETTLRHRDLELRRDVFAHMVKSDAAKAITCCEVRAVQC